LQHSNIFGVPVHHSQNVGVHIVNLWSALRLTLFFNSTKKKKKKKKQKLKGWTSELQDSKLLETKDTTSKE
jgi:hypothetical protein